MKKEILKKIWGSYPKASAALDITKGALHQWNQELNSHQIDRVFGAAIRTGVYDDKHFPERWRLWELRPDVYPKELFKDI